MWMTGFARVENLEAEESDVDGRAGGLFGCFKRRDGIFVTLRRGHQDVVAAAEEIPNVDD